MTAPHSWYRSSASTEPPPYVPGLDGTPAAAASRTPSERLLGGPPLAVAARLVVVSLLVGALLMWLDIRPFEIFDALRRLIDRLWYLGWDSVRAVLDYVVAGALIVVPCWIVLRLMSYRGR